MRKIAEIKQSIVEAKSEKAEQQLKLDAARHAWEDESLALTGIEQRIYALKEELKDAKQACFDEDGMCIAEGHMA